MIEVRKAIAIPPKQDFKVKTFTEYKKIKKNKDYSKYLEVKEESKIRTFTPSAFKQNPLEVPKLRQHDRKDNWIGSKIIADSRGKSGSPKGFNLATDQNFSNKYVVANYIRGRLDFGGVRHE
jgi:hypothetical protein